MRNIEIYESSIIYTLPKLKYSHRSFENFNRLMWSKDKTLFINEINAF